MKVCEIFESIQGESEYTGYLTTFIRFYGCSAECNWCDTKYSYNGIYKEVSNLQILDEIKNYKNRYICITGGEPLEQKEALLALIESIHSIYDANISIETNGFHSIRDIPKNIHIVMDYKLSSAKVYNNKNYFSELKKTDELKLVIANENDYTEFKKLSKEFERYLPNKNIILSPTSEMVDCLLDKFITDKLEYKFGIQIHKYINAK